MSIHTHAHAHAHAHMYIITDFYIHGRETGKLCKKNDEGYFQIL